MVLGFVREAVSHLLYETVQATGNVAGGRMSCLEAALRSPKSWLLQGAIDAHPC